MDIFSIIIILLLVIGYLFIGAFFYDISLYVYSKYRKGEFFARIASSLNDNPVLLFVWGFLFIAWIFYFLFYLLINKPLEFIISIHSEKRENLTEKCVFPDIY